MLINEVEFVDKLSGQSMDQSVSSKFDEANFDQNSTSLAVLQCTIIRMMPDHEY